MGKLLGLGLTVIGLVLIYLGAVGILLDPKIILYSGIVFGVVGIGTMLFSRPKPPRY